MTPTRNTLRGFTLIELLVVISIIGLLVSILLPALGSARDSARNSQCLSNLKQHGIAGYAFMADNQTYPQNTFGTFGPAAWHFPTMMSGKYALAIQNGAGYFFWQNDRPLNSYMGYTQGDENVGIAEWGTQQEVEIAKCPSEEDAGTSAVYFPSLTNAGYESAYDQFGSSYGDVGWPSMLNGETWLPTSLDMVERGAESHYQIHFEKYSQSDTVFMGELPFALQHLYNYGGTAPSNHGTEFGQHNVVMADGSGKRVDVEDEDLDRTRITTSIPGHPVFASSQVDVWLGDDSWKITSRRFTRP